MKHFAKIRLPTFSITIDKNEICTKNINKMFKKINTYSFSYIKKWASLVWLINYFAIRNLLCDQYYILQKLVWKNCIINWNFKETIRFGVYILLRWYLKKKKNCNHKHHDVKVKSLKWWSTVGLLLKPWPGL